MAENTVAWVDTIKRKKFLRLKNLGNSSIAMCRLAATTVAVFAALLSVGYCTTVRDITFYSMDNYALFSYRAFRRVD